MSKEKLLIVLYRDGLASSWCGYFGGAKEADEEFKLMKRDKPELVEVGRFPAVENESFSPDPNPEEE
jgi:hypothetical protein